MHRVEIAGQALAWNERVKRAPDLRRRNSPTQQFCEIPLDQTPDPADNIPTRLFDLSLPARYKSG
jgi:hypothetical protein